MSKLRNLDHPCQRAELSRRSAICPHTQPEQADIGPADANAPSWIYNLACFLLHPPAFTLHYDSLGQRTFPNLVLRQ